MGPAARLLSYSFFDALDLALVTFSFSANLDWDFLNVMK